MTDASIPSVWPSVRRCASAEARPPHRHHGCPHPDGDARSSRGPGHRRLIDDLWTGGDREAWTRGEWGGAFAFISPEMSYRAGWYAVHAEPRFLFAMGVHGQNLFVNRENGVVIAKFSSQPSRIDPQAIALTHRAVPELWRCVQAAAG